MKKIISIVISFLFIFPSYLFSFIPNKTDDNFEIAVNELSDGYVVIDGEKIPYEISGSISENGSIGGKVFWGFGDVKCDWFNYYGIKYKSDAYIKGEITYKVKGEDYTEEFFLEPSEKSGSFYSFIDDCLNRRKSNSFSKISFEPLDKENAKFDLLGIGLFNRDIPDKYVYIQNSQYKLGINLEWGGALSYLEDLDSNVQAVKADGKIRVDSNASDRYGTNSLNDHVNLINCHDTGRLVQQSYYGTSEGDYECGYYGDTKWNYNPVQGGNLYNECSKIVDLICTEKSLYIKCRPLDWAKTAEYITPSYMEAFYSLDSGVVEVSCRFVDFSGYPGVTTTQEMPAFYCVEPLNRFVYYSGNEPWSNDKNLSREESLDFWPDAGYPMFPSTENWAAFTGEFDDSFGIGLYVPHEASFLAGIYERGKTSEKDPSVDVATSYIAAVETLYFYSFSPIEYNYFISTGTVDEIRSSFNSVRK